MPAVAGSAFTSSFITLPTESVSVDRSYDLLHELWSTVFWTSCARAPLLLLDARRLFAARSRNLSRSRDPAMESHVSAFDCAILVRLFMSTTGGELPLF